LRKVFVRAVPDADGEMDGCSGEKKKARKDVPIMIDDQR